jgi:hypothetical protein
MLTYDAGGADMYRGLERTRRTQAVADIDTASSRLADLRRRRLMHACEDPLHVCKRAQYTYCSTPVLRPGSRLDCVEMVAASLINRLGYARLRTRTCMHLGLPGCRSGSRTSSLRGESSPPRAISSDQCARNVHSVLPHPRAGVRDVRPPISHAH